MWSKGRHLVTNDDTSDPNALFGREVITDDPTEFKCRSSGTNRYSHGKLVRCVINQLDLRNHHQPRYYVFEALIGPKERSRIWDQPQFWEDAFLDAVARERDLLGLDHDPTGMLERYLELSMPEKKLLDLKEDRVLASLLHNLIAFMVLLRTAKQDIYNVGYRLLGRCRLGAHFSASISSLLDCVAQLSGNAIDLWPALSDSLYRQAFVVLTGSAHSSPGAASILEIYDSTYVLRGLGGGIDVIRNLSKLLAVLVFPKSKHCVLIEESDNRVILKQLYCKKAKTLFFAVQLAMERISFQAKQITEPIQFSMDIVTNTDGLKKTLETLGSAMGMAFSKPKECHN